MEEGLLSLKWNNHKSTFFHVLSILREKHTYTDVTLACDGRLYPAHKFVLSTCSEYFSDIFTSTSGNNIVIVLKDVRRQDLEYLLDYMYLGQVDVAQSELSSLIKTAECLRIKGLAIPDDEPQKTPRRLAEEREREGSPPTKKKRHLVEEDRGNSLSSSSSASRISHLTLPPPSLPPPSQPQPGLLQRLQQQPTLTQPPQPQATSQSSSSKSHAPSLSQPVVTPPHTPRTPQVPTSPITPTSAHTHTSLASPTQATTIPVIKQEVTDPPEAPEVYMNESYEEQETKPDVSETGHLEQDMAVAGPSGLQGHADNWEGDNDLGGFTGGDSYPEGAMEEPGDSEVQGGTRHGVEDQLHPFGGLHLQHRQHRMSHPHQREPPHDKNNASTVQHALSRKRGSRADSGESAGGAGGGTGHGDKATFVHPPTSREYAEGTEGVGDSSDSSQDPLVVEDYLLHTTTLPYAHTADDQNKGSDSQVTKQLIGFDSNRYVCQWCGRNFDRISNLKRHVLLHSGIKPFKCLYCNYRATQKANVVQHLASKHREEMRALLQNNINVNDILVPSGPVKR